jgi:predicted 2-oxoglutarate/Fe(II)-dependent dioxygenase YbiX
MLGLWPAFPVNNMDIPLSFTKNEFLHRPVHLKQVFSREECAKIIREMKNDKAAPTFEKGSVKSKLVWPKEKALLDKLHNIFLHINDNYYNFDITDIREMSFLEYREGSFMNWHTDVGKPKDDSREFHYNTRKITLSILLNDRKDFAGGNLLFRPDFPLIIEQGDVVGYPSYLLHSVEPLTSGERYALLVSANGPILR